jgi:large subunit ribosomal protein L13
VDAVSYKTISVSPADIKKEWLLIDAKGQRLGRLASQVARLLKGKHKVNYTPHMDCGDNVVIINANAIELSGNKWEDKEYVHYTGHPGGQRTILAKDLMAKHPTAMLEKAIKGMLPKTKLGRAIFGNLHVYAGAEHKQQGQAPQTVELKEIR